MSDISPEEDRPPSTQPTGPTEPTAARSLTPESSPRLAPPPAGAPVPPSPGAVFVPAGLGLPVGYYTPAPAPGGRPPGVPFARRKFSLLVVGSGVVLGVVVGGVVGAGAAALAGGDHPEHSRLGTGRDSQGGSVGGRGGSDDNGR